MLKNAAVLWVIAFLLTAASAVYQRMTGPSYPVKGETYVGESLIDYRLERSHGGPDDCDINFTIPDENVTAILSYKRYKTDDNWTHIEMMRHRDSVYSKLPHQPPAGKRMYYVTLSDGSNTVKLPEIDPVVIRFKGAVPQWVLIPHVFFMFTSMFVATRAGLEALFRKKNVMKLAYWTTGLMFIGGMILGPVMQEYAFGELWTGFPFGYDLTDNKTLIAMIGWFAAVYFGRKKPEQQNKWVVFASLLTFIIFIIPHSVLGSELDYSKMDTGN